MSRHLETKARLVVLDELQRSEWCVAVDQLGGSCSSPGVIFILIQPLRLDLWPPVGWAPLQKIPPSPTEISTQLSWKELTAVTRPDSSGFHSVWHGTFLLDRGSVLFADELEANPAPQHFPNSKRLRCPNDSFCCHCECSQEDNASCHDCNFPEAFPAAISSTGERLLTRCLMISGTPGTPSATHTRLMGQRHSPSQKYITFMSAIRAFSWQDYSERLPVRAAIQGAC